MGDFKRIGVMMELDKPFKRHLSVYGGILEYARRHSDWRLILDDWAGESLPARRGKPVPYDGIVGRLTPLAAERARRLNVPAVNVWLSSPAKGLPSVFPDYAASGKLVADHLLGRGFRSLGALLQDGDTGVVQQATAMKEFAETEGFDRWVGTESIAEPKTYDEWRRAIQTIQCWMASWKPPLGLLVRDPGYARAIIELAHERGWNVPEQIAIVCSNNDEMHCDRPEPGLTAVEMPDEQCGHDAARMLDGLIDACRKGKCPFKDPKTVYLAPVGIVSRHSTDFFAVEDPLVGQALRFIGAHLAKPLSADRVARELKVTRRTLDLWFQKALNTTVTGEICRLRIERVKRELTSGSDTAEAIARQTGFGSKRTLNEQFRRATGMSPSEFRKAGRAHA